MPKIASLLIALVLSVGLVQPAFAMQVFVRVPNSQTISVDVEPSDLVENLKTLIQDKAGYQPSQQRLIFGHLELQDDRTLADYNVQHLSTVDLVLNLPAPVPTLSEWATFLLALALASGAAVVIQRRRYS